MNMKNNGQMDFLMGGNAISMSMPNLSNEDKAAAIKTFNDVTKDAQTSFLNNINKELAQSKKAKEEAVNLEMLPLGPYVLYRCYDKNPWDQVTTTESGLIVPIYNGMEFSKETGSKEKQNMIIGFGEVVEVGSDVKYIKPGDDIIFRNGTSLPVPFLGQHLWAIGYNNIIVTINEGLTERFKQLNENK